MTNQFVVRFTADQQKIIKEIIQALSQFDPTGYRPVLPGRTAAQMEAETCQALLVQLQHNRIVVD